MVKIAPSILAANFEKLEEEIESVVRAGADMIHVDVMDGKFVNNETPGLEMLKRARTTTDIIIDSHLMVQDPENWIEDFLLSDIISFHIESVCEEMAKKIIDRIHDYGIKASIAIKPGTPIETILPFLNQLDMVLIMTVEPGYGGQAMIEKCLEKVKILREWKNDIDIEVDGGINIETVEKAKSAGANVIVAGTAIFKADNPKEVIQKLRE